MPSIIQTIPKHRTDSDRTLDAVLEAVVEGNRLNRKLLAYTIEPSEVVLTYQGNS